MLIYLIVNLFVLAVFYYHGNSFPQAIYECLKKQFFIVIVSMVLKSIGKFVVLAIRKNFQNSHVYASTNAFIGTAFLTSYVFMFCIMMSGLPAQPVPVTIQDTTVIIGETKAIPLKIKVQRAPSPIPKTTTSTTVSFSKSSGIISPLAL